MQDTEGYTRYVKFTYEARVCGASFPSLPPLPPNDGVKSKWLNSRLLCREPNLHSTFLVMPRDKYAQIFARTLITDSRGGVFQISRGVTRGPLIFHVWKTGIAVYVRLRGCAIHLVIPITLISRLIEREDRVDFLR